MYHEKGRHVLGGCFRVGVYSHQTENYHDHHQGVDHEADAHALYGVARILKGFGVLDEDRDVGELEGPVDKRGVKGAGQRQLLGGHSVHGVGNLRQAGDDIWNVHNQQAGNDADGQHGCHLAHQVGAENGNHKDKDADDKGTKQVRQSRQSAQCRAAGGEGHGGSHAHDANVQNLKEVGKNGSESAVKGVVVGTVIVNFMFSGKTQAVGEEDRIVQHGKDRHQQTVDTVAHIITVNLCAGGEAAPEMCGKPHEGYAKDNGG